jgi:hypothetical protein
MGSTLSTDEGTSLRAWADWEVEIRGLSAEGEKEA